MTVHELTAAMLDRGLKHIDAVLVGAWSDSDRREAETFVSGGPAPDWIHAFDDDGVLGSDSTVSPRQKKQRELFE